MRSHLLVGWTVLLMLSAVAFAAKPASQAAERITRHELQVPTSDQPIPYLIYEPAAPVSKEKRALLIYLHGAGGSIKSYNLKREPYAKLRAELAQRGYYILVPDLGPRHFMNDAAKRTLDALVDRVLADYGIDARRVHVMGTSMGGGGALAYAIHRPAAVRSVCAVMPMTDFARWIEQSPKYAPALADAYGGTPSEKPQAYEANSALRNLAAFAKVPVLLIHGTADTIVPYEHSARLFEALTARGYSCALRSVEGLSHADAIMNDYQVEAVDFFDAAMR